MAAVLSIPFEISASITLGKGLFQCRGEKSDYKFKKKIHVMLPFSLKVWDLKVVLKVWDLKPEKHFNSLKEQ